MMENTEKEISVLFVDDDENALSSLKRLFAEEPLELFTAKSGKEALEILKNKEIGVIISDQRMPEMNGAQFLERAKRMAPYSVRMVLTAYADMTTAVDAINKGGAWRYITKPWDDNELVIAVKKAIETYRITRENIYLTQLTIKQNQELEKWNTELETYVQQQTMELTRRNRELIALNDKLDRNVQFIITVFSNLIDLKCSAVRNHSSNVASVATAIAERMRLTENAIKTISIAAKLHDIGKTGIPDIVLSKDPAVLAPDEMVEYKKHAILGQSAVDAVEGLRDAGVLIRHHHELFDGSGFPDGLKGTTIPLGSRIIAIADAFDRIVASGNEKADVSAALGVIESSLNKQFDPDLFEYISEVTKGMAVSFASTDSNEEVEMMPNKLLPGMVLSKDVRTGTGLLLLNKGAILDEKYIDIVRRYYYLDPAHTGIYVTVDRKD